MPAASAPTIDPARVASLLAREEEAFVRARPRSAALAEQRAGTWLGGVPMNWMRRWPGPFPVVAAEAAGARLIDVDGHEYVDLCLGDTGAMCGHAPPATVEAIRAQVGRALTTMLPSEDSTWVGVELQRRFGLPSWQLAMTATDANRFALRIARHVTGRDKVLVFNWCYHGSVDEALAVEEGGQVIPRPGSVGPPVPPAETTRVVEFNDLDALETALAPGDVAAVLAEPALTNIGIVLPDPGFHAELRRLSTETGTLLIVDETHTICAGPGGATARWGLQPDLLTIGKPIAGGFPAAAYGMSAAVAGAAEGAVTGSPESDVSGVGGTLTGNALAVAAIRATLGSVLVDEAWGPMEAMAERFTDGVSGVLAQFGLPWHVQRLGCRAEYWFSPPPRTGGQAATAVDHGLEALLHLGCLNRGVLLTPFHNMALMCPVTSEADVDRHTEAFAEITAGLVAR